MAQSEFSKKIAKQFELITTSFHEAGHAIFALLSKMNVPVVYVYYNKKNNRVEGSCHYEIPEFKNIENKILFKKLVECEIGIKYAGLIAEKYHFQTLFGLEVFPLFLRNGSSDDTISASKIIKSNKIVSAGKKRYDFKKKKSKQILNILKSNWQDVTLVAHSLFKKKKLSFQDLKKLLTNKSVNKIFWRSQFKTIEKLFNNLSSLDENKIKFILSL
jgi:hypothetical protein